MFRWAEELYAPVACREMPVGCETDQGGARHPNPAIPSLGEPASVTGRVQGQHGQYRFEILPALRCVLPVRSRRVGKRVTPFTI